MYDLTEAYPELIPVLKELGFLGVANALTRNTIGRVTTIPQGCKKMGTDLNVVIKKLEEKGFTVMPWLKTPI
ncbi:MAG: DUF1858 domain-containing protein [Chloroflexi bacterium]|nr:DUF1858 domain-containing protein [Chloroflexota bacterium]